MPYSRLLDRVFDRLFPERDIISFYYKQDQQPNPIRQEINLAVRKLSLEFQGWFEIIDRMNRKSKVMIGRKKNSPWPDETGSLWES